MAGDIYPTFIVIDYQMGRWMGTLVRIRKEKDGKVYEEVGIVSANEESALIELARSIERGDLSSASHGSLHPEPVIGKYYPFPDWVKLETYHPTWTKMET